MIAALAAVEPPIGRTNPNAATMHVSAWYEWAQPPTSDVSPINPRSIARRCKQNKCLSSSPARFDPIVAIVGARGLSALVGRTGQAATGRLTPGHAAPAGNHGPPGS